MRSFIKSSVLLMLLSSNMAFAGLMVQSNLPTGGLLNIGTATDPINISMTEFALPSGADASSATSLTGGHVVDFQIKNGDSYDMDIGVRNPLNSLDPDNWWNGVDDEFYYTGVGSHGTSWLELIMPSNTIAFSLSIDANCCSAWVLGVADDGSAIDTNEASFTLNSDGSGDFLPNNPGYTIDLGGAAMSYSFYADNNSSGTCNTINKVVIDPHYWGMGDFAINVDDNACAVPEPSVIALFAAGLIGLGFARRRRA